MITFKIPHDFSKTSRPGVNHIDENFDAITEAINMLAKEIKKNAESIESLRAMVRGICDSGGVQSKTETGSKTGIGTAKGRGKNA